MLEAAYGLCQARVRQQYENFPVASLLVPRSLRPHIAAVYAFARLADDLADEPLAPAGSSAGGPAVLGATASGTTPEAGRLALLDDCERQLDQALVGRADQPVFVALGETIRMFSLPVALFRDLLSAFRQDVTVTRYADREALLDYCRRSANPIGRIVLRVFGHDDPGLDARADAICTALQLTNFWQDVASDWRRGRVYLPDADRAARACDDSDIAASRVSPAFAALLADEIRWTRELFARGRDLCDLVAGRLKWELKATWLGGMRILDQIEAVEYDVFRRRPALGWRGAGRLAAGVLFWRPRAS